MSVVRAPQRQRSLEGSTGRPLRDERNRAVVAPAGAAAFCVPSEPSDRTVVFDHRQSSVAPRRRRLRLGWISFVIVVVVPAIIAAAYYFLVAADQ